MGCGRYTTALLSWESQSAHSHSLTHSLTFTHIHLHSLTHPHCQLTTYLVLTHSLTFTHFHSLSLTFTHFHSHIRVISQLTTTSSLICLASLTHTLTSHLPPPHTPTSPLPPPRHSSPPLPTHQMCIFPNFPYVEIITKSETGVLQYTSAARAVSILIREYIASMQSFVRRSLTVCAAQRR